MVLIELSIEEALTLSLMMLGLATKAAKVGENEIALAACNIGRKVTDAGKLATATTSI